MNNFTFCTPTKVIFGNSGEDKVADLIADRGCKKVLIHYGGQSAVKSGLVRRMQWLLDNNRIKHVELGGVQPNPRLPLVYEGIELCKAEEVDFILAVGGGSVIDSAKAIGMGVANGGDVWDFYCKKRVPQKTLPVGVVLTIAAAGSEMSNSSVITDDRDGGAVTKRGCNAEISRPAFAVLNPQLTLTVPAYPTACGCADIFMHTLERYLTGGDTMGVTDGVAEAVMTVVITSSKAVMNHLTNYEARANLMWAGSISHNGLTACGSDGGDWCTHSLGHEISARYDVAHGASLTAMWGAWARYVYKNCLNRFHKFAVQVMGVRPSGTKESLALKGIQAAEEWFKSLGMPTSIHALGVNPSQEELHLMAKKWAENNGGKRGSCMLLGEEDALKIYTAAL